MRRQNAHMLIDTGTPELEIREKRQPRLTEKGKAYRLTELERQRKGSKREIQMQVYNIQALMGLDENLDQVSKEVVNLNTLFKHFGDLHEEILELVTEEERVLEARNNEELCQEILKIQTLTQHWMAEVNKRMQDNKSVKGGLVRKSFKV